LFGKPFNDRKSNTNINSKISEEELPVQDNKDYITIHCGKEMYDCRIFFIDPNNSKRKEKQQKILQKYKVNNV
jgi:hypothetical protein